MDEERFRLLEFGYMVNIKTALFRVSCVQFELLGETIATKPTTVPRQCCVVCLVGCIGARVSSAPSLNVSARVCVRAFGSIEGISLRFIHPHDLLSVCLLSFLL